MGYILNQFILSIFHCGIRCYIKVKQMSSYVTQLTVKTFYEI